MSERTLLVHPGALGDVVLLGHLAGALEGELTLAAGAAKAALLAGLGRVGAWLDFAALPMHELFTDGAVEQGELAGRLGRFDRLISFFGDPDTPAARRLARACGAGESHFLPVRPPPDWPGHLLDLWTDRLGLPRLDPAPPAWPVPPEWRAAARALLTRRGVPEGAPLAVIHPGSGSPAKNWPMERFVHIAANLEATGLRVAWVLGEVELERGLAPPAGAAGVCLSDPPLDVLAGVLARARLYLGNDSGVTHLSAAVGAPTVALFATGSSRPFAPRGPAVQVVSGDSMQATGLPHVLAAVLAHAGLGISDSAGR